MDPERAKGYFELGYALQAQGKTREAIESYRKSLTKRHDYATAHYNMALGLQTLKDEAGALKGLKAAVHYRPDYADAHLALAIMLERKGDKKGALEHAEKALRLAPQDTRCKHLVAQLRTKDKPQEKPPPKKKDYYFASTLLLPRNAASLTFWASGVECPRLTPNYSVSGNPRNS
jgi:tetratricopeptide (TPR) repeat protein